MMEQLRQLAEMGADNAAREMMSNLRNMLEMLRNAALNPMNNPEVEAAQEMMEELKDITQQQSDMLNETFEQARQQSYRETKTAKHGAAGVNGGATFRAETNSLRIIKTSPRRVKSKTRQPASRASYAKGLAT